MIADRMATSLAEGVSAFGDPASFQPIPILIPMFSLQAFQWPFPSSPIRYSSLSGFQPLGRVVGRSLADESEFRTGLTAVKLQRPPGGRYCYGGGLVLQVSNGHKAWLFRFERDGHELQMGLGSASTLVGLPRRVSERGDAANFCSMGSTR